MSQQLQSFIDSAWEERANFSPKSAPADVRNAVADVLERCGVKAPASPP